MSNVDEVPTDLDPSLLGTKQHWDEVYAREISNHAHDGEDEGTVWFDESGAEEAVVRLLDSFADDQQLLHRSGPQASRILDLGCGNGHMLFTLRQADADQDDDGLLWSGSMVGVDYSEASIHLAQQIAKARDLDPGIAFYKWDILIDEAGDWLKGGFDLVLDKGTFDAISLMPQEGAAQHSCKTYCDRVVPLLRPGGVLVITSCNWTKGELLSWFAQGQPESRLALFAEATYPSFTFGGRIGQSVVTLALSRQTS